MTCSFFAKNGSLTTKVLLALFIILILTSLTLSVYAADVDVDGFDDSTPTENFPKDCDDASAAVRPLKNQSETLVGYNIKICPYKYYNTTIIVNESSNGSLFIDCSGTDGAFANFSVAGTNTSLRNLILINNTVAGVNIVNCSALGYYQHGGTTAGGGIDPTTVEKNNTAATDSLVINITNSSNINISKFQIREFSFGGIFIGGHAANGNQNNGTVQNISIFNSGLVNFTTGNLDPVHIGLGTNINFTGNNFTLNDNITVSSIVFNITVPRVYLYNNLFDYSNTTAFIRSNETSHQIINNSFGNASYSIFLSSAGFGGNHTIRENNFTSLGDPNTTGLFLRQSGNNTLSGNFFKNFTGVPIHLLQSSSNFFLGTILINTTEGIRINTSSHNTIQNATIINATWGTGIIIIQNSSNNNTLLNNSIVFNGSFALGAGIFVRNASHNNISRNDINNLGGSHGIVLMESNNATVSTNTIRNTSIGLNLTGLSGQAGDGRQVNRIINITIYNASTYAINDTTGTATNNSIIFNTSNGAVAWQNLTDASIQPNNFFLGTAGNITITSNFTDVNLTVYPRLNTTALAVFILASGPPRPVAYKNSTRCDVGTCTSVGVTGTSYEFNISDWRTGSTQGEANLSIGNAVDSDGDDFATTGGNNTFPNDCDDASANIRPVKNISETLVGYTLKLCPGTYHNATLVVNVSSNNSVMIDCAGQSGANGNFSLGGTARREWILVNNTNAGVNIVNCTFMGLFYGNGSAQDPKDQATTTVGINLTNSSNVNVSTVLLKHLIFPGLVIGGLNDGSNGTAANISIINNGFDNITGDMLWARIGTNINITGNNFTISRDNQSTAININLTTPRVVVYNNKFSSAAQAQLRTNESSHSILNNSFGDGNSTTAEIAIYTGDNHTILDNNFSISTVAGSRALYLEGSGNTTLKANRVMNITGGIGLELNSSSSNTISNNLFANSSINVLINTSSNDVNFSNNDVIFAVSAPGYGLVVNTSDNLTLQNNTYRNNSVGGVVFYNATNITALGEHVYNSSIYGYLFNHSSNSRLQNISADGNNNTANTFALDSSANLTLDGFNSTNANGAGMFIINATRINLSRFNIINASVNGLQILNSTNISSDYNDVAISNINGSSLALINISWNSSYINLSTLILAGGFGGTGDASTPRGYGIYVNQSSFISFHNITIRNTTNTSIIYSNTTGTSVIGLCTVTNSSTSVFNIVADQTTFSTFNCTRIENANMSGVTLKVSSATGTSVAFNVGVNFTGVLDTYVNTSVADLVYVNTTALGGGLLPANVTMAAYGYDADGVLVDYEEDGTFHGCGINCTMTTTGLSLAFNVSHFSSYQASRKVVGNSVGGGGGSGGGRGGGYKTITPTASGVTAQLTNYDVARIQYSQNAYQFLMKRAGKEEVDLRIAQQDYKLGVGKALGVDLDKDGTTDVTVSLVSVTHNLATFVVRLGAPASAPTDASVTEPTTTLAPLDEQTGAVVEEPSVPTQEAAIVDVSVQEKKHSLQSLLTLALVGILVVAIIVYMKKKRATV